MSEKPATQLEEDAAGPISVPAHVISSGAALSPVLVSTAAAVAEAANAAPQAASYDFRNEVDAFLAMQGKHLAKEHGWERQEYRVDVKNWHEVRWPILDAGGHETDYALTLGYDNRGFKPHRVSFSLRRVRAEISRGDLRFSYPRVVQVPGDPPLSSRLPDILSASVLHWPKLRLMYDQSGKIIAARPAPDKLEYGPLANGQSAGDPRVFNHLIASLLTWWGINLPPHDGEAWPVCPYKLQYR